MHLGIKIQTRDNHQHDYKVPVPENTTVNTKSFSNDNNLDRLQFDKCSLMDHFDPTHKHVYSEITTAEHDTRQKEYVIHNFYRNF